ncbi:hypothetical protein QTG54_016951 [Skeletonema marinoi]|uniref:Uncharacterized protein n=1 Tax=Skeletonema marinoi TaxID=267567 RepID=A0AAD9D460_9STRA|nr:hypothetical protein QTG54_016951 [Skeletonema marinoi]
MAVPPEDDLNVVLIRHHIHWMKEEWLLWRFKSKKEIIVGVIGEMIRLIFIVGWFLSLIKDEGCSFNHGCDYYSADNDASAGLNWRRLMRKCFVCFSDFKLRLVPILLFHLLLTAIVRRRRVDCVRILWVVLSMYIERIPGLQWKVDLFFSRSLVSFWGAIIMNLFRSFYYGVEGSNGAEGINGEEGTSSQQYIGAPSIAA